MFQFLVQAVNSSTEKSSRRFLVVLACFVVVLVGSGIYLIQRDLQVLVSQRQHAIEQSLVAAKALISPELRGLELPLKDSGSEQIQELQSMLAKLQSDLQLQGRLGLAQRQGQDYRFFASTDPLWKTQSLSEEFLRNLQERQKSTGPVEKTEQGYSITSFMSFAENPETALVFESQESSFFYQTASILLNYVLLFVGLAFLGGLSFFHFYSLFQRQRRLVAIKFTKLYEEGIQAALVTNSQLELINANPQALEVLARLGDEIEGLSLAQIETLIPLETNWSNVLSKLKRSDSFQFKTKLITEQNRVRYLQWKVFPSKDECLFLVQDITAKSIQKVEDANFYDSMTQLPNIQYLESLFESQKNRFANEKHSILMIAPIILSHSSLPQFAGFLRDYFRQTDLVLFYRENIFIVVLTGSLLENAYRIAQNLPKLILESGKPEIQNLKINVGTAELSAKESLYDWINRAEAALQTAQQIGPNRIEAQEADSLEVLDGPHLESSTSEIS